MADPFDTKSLPSKPDHIAPDGSEVRELLTLPRGGLAHFRLAPGKASIPMTHSRVEELWYVVRGHGEMWRKQSDREEVVTFEPGVSVSIPVGTLFQFRSDGSEPLEAIGATMPPWEGPHDATRVDGRWTPAL